MYRKRFAPRPAQSALGVLVFLLQLTYSSQAFPAAGEQPLAYDRDQSLAALDIIERLGRYHYVRLPVDDALSGQLLDNYLDNLDPGRNVFLKSDVIEFPLVDSAMSRSPGRPSASTAREKTSSYP